MTDIPVKKKKKKEVKISIRTEWCKGCRICVEFCPKAVLVMDGFLVKVADLEACNKCGICEDLCPDFAIVVE